MSLVDDALKLPQGKRTDTDDEVRLAVAWQTGVITDAQAATVLRTSVNNIAGRLARILRRATIEGRSRTEFLR